MTKHLQNPIPASQESRGVFDYLALLVCLGVLALRITYTEAPTAQTGMTAGNFVDTIYSLTLSGLLIFTFVLWLLQHIFTGRLHYRFTGMEVGLALFAAAAVVSTYHASDKRAAITQSVILLAPICAALLLAQILNQPGRTRLVLVLLAALGLVSAYACAEQFFISNAITIEEYQKSPEAFLTPLGIEPGGFQQFLFEHRLYGGDVRGFFTTSNSAASFAILACAAGVALLLWRLAQTKAHQVAPRYVLYTALPAVLAAAGLFLTRSKGGILAFCAGLAACVLLVLINRRFPTQRQRLLAILAGFILLFMITAGGAMVHYGLKHGRLPGGNSMLVRWQYWTASARMIADHALTGVGPGNFSDYYTRYKPPAALESVADPHNLVLSLLTQFGPLGLIGFLAMVLTPLWRSLAAPMSESPALESRPQVSFRAIAFLILFGVSGCLFLTRLLLIPSAADNPEVRFYEIVTLHVAPVAAFLIGFLLAASPLDEKPGPRVDFAGPGITTVLACAILAVLLHNLIDYALFEPGVWTAFWVVMACLVATHREQPVELPVGIHAARIPKPLVVDAGVVLLALYFLFIWKPAYDTAAGLRQVQLATAVGNYDAAHQDLVVATQSDALSPIAANLNGRLYLQQSVQAGSKQTALLEEAARCFTEAVERSPADYKNYEKLAAVYARLKQPQKAYDWYLKAAGLYPGCERLWFELARTAEQLGKPGIALCHYAKAIEIEDSYRQQFRQMYPDHVKVVSRLGDKEYQLAKERIQELSK